MLGHLAFLPLSPFLFIFLYCMLYILVTDLFSLGSGRCMMIDVKNSAATVCIINPSLFSPFLVIAHRNSPSRCCCRSFVSHTTTPALLRAVLNRFADLMERDTEILAELESWNSGKGVRIARESDVADTVACLRYYAGMADKFFGQTIDTFGKDKLIYTLHEPIGVCGQM